MTKIMPCSCTHPFQDRTYGAGRRVHNWTVKPEGWRCTVCASHKPAKGEPRKAEA